MDVGPLDSETINTLREVLEGEFDNLINTFLSDVPEKIKQLYDAEGTADVAALEMVAHTLKGSSGNVGAMALSGVCGELVKAIRTNSLGNAKELVDRVDAEFSRVKPLLEAEKGG